MRKFSENEPPSQRHKNVHPAHQISPTGFLFVTNLKQNTFCKRPQSVEQLKWLSWNNVATSHEVSCSKYNNHIWSWWFHVNRIPDDIWKTQCSMQISSFKWLTTQWWQFNKRSKNRDFHEKSAVHPSVKNHWNLRWTQTVYFRFTNSSKICHWTFWSCWSACSIWFHLELLILFCVQVNPCRNLIV